MELFLHRFGGSRFRESKDRGKMPSTQLFGVQLGCNSARAGDEKVGTERKIVCRRLENHSPEIEKSFGADFSASLYTLTHSRLDINKNINSFYFGSNRHFLLCPIPIP